MDFEKRLRDHMSEQADRIEIDSASPTSITEASRTRAPITTLAALAVIIAAAAGFFALSQDEGSTVTEVAAGQADDAADTSADTEAPTFETADYAPVQFTDISSENSPGYGRVFTDGGVYFVLSSAPGRVTFDENTTDEEFMEAYRMDTLYVYSGDAGWTVQDLGDRFISDFQIDDGVLYAVSTGSKTEDVAAFGTSTDRGQSWTWNQLEQLPEIDSITMLVGNDRDPVFFASRWGYPDYEKVLATAKDAGIVVNDMTLRGFDSEGFSYIEIDPNDPCALVRAQYLPEIAGVSQWMNNAPTEEQDIAQQEFDSMIGWMKEEIAGTGCEWDDAWLTEFSDPAAAETIDWPEETRVEWSDIGFEPPESWSPWATTYTFDGENFVDRGVPFGDGVEFGGTFVRDDRLTISVWDPTIMRQFETSVDFDEESYQEAMSEAETVWSTTDGIEWISESRDYNDESFYYDGNFYEPRAGNQRFQVSWAHYEEEWADTEAEVPVMTATTLPPSSDGAVDSELSTTTAPADASTLVTGADNINVTTTTEGGSVADVAAEEAMMEEGAYEYYQEPDPELQRSIAGGPWETVTLAELAPNIDVGDRALSEVRGSSLGVFLVYSPRYTQDGPPQGNQILVHSNNGVDWEQHEVDADYLDFYGSDTGEGEILAFANRWNYTETGGGSQETKAILISAAG